MEPPVVYPRASLTLVEPAIERQLREAPGLGAAELGAPRHELVDRLARLAAAGGGERRRWRRSGGDRGAATGR